MKMQGRFGLAAAVLLVLPTLASAQQHAMGSFGAAPSVPASASVAPAVHSSAVQTHAGTRTSGARMVTAAPTGMGAGEHLAAIDHSKDIKALIDPAKQARLAERHRRRKPKTFNGFIFLDGGGAYVLPVDAGAGLNGDADEQVAQDQGQDQGQVQSAPQERAQAQELQQQEQLDAGNARLAEEQSASLPDEGEFTLILRSGQEIEAVAFTRVDDRIVYVTVGGGRRTVAVRDVDVDATVRLNQERGTPLQISL
jgi:septum formation inhibitor MinC